MYFVFEIGPNGSLDDVIKSLRAEMPEPVIKIMFAQLVNFVEFL